jgi:hypothetical protein
MKLKCCNDFQIVIDINDDIDDDDVVMIPKPFVFTCLAKDHVPPIKNPLVFPTPTYERPTFFWHIHSPLASLQFLLSMWGAIASL